MKLASVQAVTVIPTNMAEGEINIDNLISRLLDGEPARQTDTHILVYFTYLHI